jgi:hypothetical protein
MAASLTPPHPVICPLLSSSNWLIALCRSYLTMIMGHLTAFSRYLCLKHCLTGFLAELELRLG